MSVVLVIAPHPDDETLGCGGTLLKHKSQGDDVFWLIVTSIHERSPFSDQVRLSRKSEIENVSRYYGFKNTYELGFPTTELDTVPKSGLIKAIGKVIAEVNPNVLYVPYRNDIHSDHEVVFDAVAACTKSFRYPSVRAVRAYETLSETEFGIRPEDGGFRPNYFVDITEFIDRKIEIMGAYQSEIQVFPMPRSLETIRALGIVRGAVIGSAAAEAFMSLREIA